MPPPRRRRATAAHSHCRYESREARHRAAAAPPPRRHRARCPPFLSLHSFHYRPHKNVHAAADFVLLEKATSS
ncbi:hypothetical protein JYU34_009070 [Plutella xylostella]|uniref:Uncharacterized protein n=1 Tax=Plutella xylostella TaxID=51655 RepID=A0ABQ7QMH8_PLUXY|nr:hypothetical protein JYU34_009070 [Plutella xylostella]